MSRILSSKLGEMEYDGLISDVNPVILVRGGVIAALTAAAVFARGTVLAKSIASGKLYILGSSGSAVHVDFTGDGTATAFKISAAPAKLTGVTVGGTAKTEGTDFAYNPGTGFVTFTAAPAVGAAVVCSFTDELIQDCILCDDTDIGTSADAAVDVYIGGCFNPDKLTVKSGYTITEADRDKLREKGIVLKPVLE